MDPVYRMDLVVPAEAMDDNRHANNVAYVQWMQEAAVRHSAACGGAELTRKIGATWVVRAHRIDYLSPAVAGDALTILTWVVDFRKVRSTRRYKFIRNADRTVLARGETEWVFVDAAAGRPRAIPEEVSRAYGTADEPEG